MAVVDFFLKLDGIPGESQDGKFPNQIDVLSWSWGETQTGTFAGGGGGGAGKVSMQDFHFVMKANKATPKLMLACADGQHIKEGTLTCRKAGGKQEPYLSVKLSDVLVSSYQTGGSHGDVVPTDQISLNFSKIELEYKEQKADGSMGSPTHAGWDVKKNAKI